ncbi:metallophosphoesterase family protein [Sinomonas susongensis]|uniref:metallophosphoesterase family protein n=1 Tax=Sinomonas susongensis TaxID=1324851 RepID=UPI001486E29C|nr:metallophosphoesterase [Sinomonas susongensis]
MKILIAGDWHRDAHWAVETIKAARQQGLRHVIHLGDLGAFWPSDYPEPPSRTNSLGKAYGFTRSLSDAVRDANIKFMFIDGNNDNHEFLAQLPRRRRRARMMGLTYLPRGTRFRLGGRRFGALGGAYSLDRGQRRHHVDWWPEEEPTAEDVRRLGDRRLDVLLAHEVPASVELPASFPVRPETEAEANRTRELVQAAVEATRPAQLFAGHWHQRLTVPVPGSDTVLQVLDMQRRLGNSVVLDTKTLTVEPFVQVPARRDGPAQQERPA